ncbi:hypothetical protein ASG78_13990 [Nostocoides sp. Soil756]|nr:hypothetical protein ASG78_13990 [Tetrasphaera sp. Soil756]
MVARPRAGARELRTPCTQLPGAFRVPGAVQPRRAATLLLGREAFGIAPTRGIRGLCMPLV